MIPESRRLAWIADGCEAAPIWAKDFDIQPARLCFWHQQCLGGQEVRLRVLDQYSRPKEGLGKWTGRCLSVVDLAEGSLSSGTNEC